MRRLVFVVVGCAVFAAGVVFGQSTAPEANKAFKDDVQKLMELTGQAEMAVQMLDQMMPAFKQQMPQVPAEFWDRFRAKVDPQRLVDLVIPIYMKYLTHEDVKGLIEFFGSPLGKKLVEVQPMIMKESFGAGQQWGFQLGQQVVQELQKEGISLQPQQP